MIGDRWSVITHRCERKKTPCKSGKWKNEKNKEKTKTVWRKSTMKGEKRKKNEEKNYSFNINSNHRNNVNKMSCCVRLICDTDTGDSLYCDVPWFSLACCVEVRCCCIRVNWAFIWDNNIERLILLTQFRNERKKKMRNLFIASEQSCGTYPISHFNVMHLYFDYFLHFSINLILCHIFTILLEWMGRNENGTGQVDLSCFGLPFQTPNRI